MANVFISYRKADLQEAERLAVAIRQSGHRVWFDEWKIDLGDSIIGEINEGLEGTAYVILCYSSTGVTSRWMGREWMSALARQLNGVNIKILPVLLTGGTPPAILEDVKYADLVKDWSQGLQEVLRAIR